MIRLYQTEDRRISFVFILLLSLAWFGLVARSTLFAQNEPSITVNWQKTTTNRTVPTLQAVVNPMLRRGSPLHDAAFEALRRMGTNYVRYAFWLPYPKLAVAEP